MTHQEIEQLLQSILSAEQQPLAPPLASDWLALTSRLGCVFSPEFRSFIELMAKYQFPGDIYNVSSGGTNGNDLIEVVYGTELQMGHWNPDMIPFYGIGNGDYFCLSKQECPDSAVYYYYADRGDFGKYSPSFEDWLRNLPAFLAATP